VIYRTTVHRGDQSALIHVRAAGTTADWVEFLWVAYLLQFEEDLVRGHNALVDYVVSRSQDSEAFAAIWADYRDYSGEPELLLQTLTLARAIAQHGALPESDAAALREFYDLAYITDGYDDKLSPKPCQCPRCEGAADDADNCLFAGVPDRLGTLAAVDWELASDCWDRPLYVYQARSYQRRSAAKKMAIPIQQRTKKQQETAKATEIVHRILGGGA
jgi:hypothetical protein